MLYYYIFRHNLCIHTYFTKSSFWDHKFTNFTCNTAKRFKIKVPKHATFYNL